MAVSVIVIGGGAAGIDAALTAARGDAQVTLVHDGPLGGRTAYGSLVPSKVWLDAATPQATPATILARFGAVTSGWVAAQRELLSQAGVTLVAGRARLTGPGTVSVAGHAEPLCADAIILAAGSEPTFTQGVQPDGKRVIAPRHLAALDWLPARTVVVGGGATGTEMVQLFAALGSAVTWVTGHSGVLPEFARRPAQVVRDSFITRGVEVVEGVRVETVERGDDTAVVVVEGGARYTAELVFVATGRRADLVGQGLESIGIVTEVASDVAVDGFGQVQPGVYVVGDAAGEPFLANAALSRARVAARHAVGLPTESYDPATVVHAVYSQPEIAQVGVLAGDDVESIEIPLDMVLKAHLRSWSGWFALAWDGDRRVTGGWVVGEHAADALGPVTVAIAAGATIDQLAAAWPAYPTIGELAPHAARHAT